MDAKSTSLDGRRTDMRARILEVASRHFRERGYSVTSMQEIADELGVTKAALYYHFESKIEILHALLEPIFSAVEGILAGDVDCSTARGRRDYLADLIETFDAAGPVVASVAIDPRAAADILETVSTSTLVDRIAAHLVEGLVREGRVEREISRHPRRWCTQRHPGDDRRVGPRVKRRDFDGSTHAGSHDRRRRRRT